MNHDQQPAATSAPMVIWYSIGGERLSAGDKIPFGDGTHALQSVPEHEPKGDGIESFNWDESQYGGPLLIEFVADSEDDAIPANGDSIRLREIVAERLASQREFAAKLDASN